MFFGNEKYPKTGIFLYYDDDDFSQSYGQIIEGFSALTKDVILQPYISHDNFRSSKNGADDNGYKLCF